MGHVWGPWMGSLPLTALPVQQEWCPWLEAPGTDPRRVSPEEAAQGLVRLKTFTAPLSPASMTACGQMSSDLGCPWAWALGLSVHLGHVLSPLSRCLAAAHPKVSDFAIVLISVRTFPKNH